jgi:hypothetical protein
MYKHMVHIVMMGVAGFVAGVACVSAIVIALQVIGQLLEMAGH